MKKELAQAVLDAFSACPELKEAAQNFIDSEGTEKEAEAWSALVAEAEADIIPIDGAIAFLKSDKAKEIFGEAVANEKLAETGKNKANGEKYCGCPGCVAAKAIIEYK